MTTSTEYRYDVQGTGESRTGLGARIFAWRYSRCRQPAAYTARRRELLAGLRGTVLEIGPGAGANLEHLPSAVSWIGLEPNVYMHDLLRAKAAERGIAARILAGAADAIPLPNDSVDAVIGTLVLCSVDDQDRVLTEIRRVLAPGGRYLFLEHVAAQPGTWVRRLQEALTPVSRRCQGGCRPNRETWRAIERAGFAETDLRRFALQLPLGLHSPYISGHAIKGADR